MEEEKRQQQINNSDSNAVPVDCFVLNRQRELLLYTLTFYLTLTFFFQLLSGSPDICEGTASNHLQTDRPREPPSTLLKL